MFYSSSRQKIIVLISLLMTSVSGASSLGATEITQTNSKINLNTKETLTQVLLAQRRFGGFSGRYGAAPRRRSTPFRRGSCLPPQAQVTALFPSEDIITDPQNQENLGKDRTWFTNEAYPTIYFHLPQNSALTAEVVIENSNREIVYSALVSLPDQEVNPNNPRRQGFIGIDLGEKADELGIPALEPTENYLWEVQIICNNLDRSGNPLVSGWITHIDSEESESINSLISNKTDEEIPWIYSDNGIWYSTLNTLAHNYLSQSDNQGWVTLLEAVGYNRIAEDPLIGMAEVEQIYIGVLPEIEF